MRCRKIPGFPDYIVSNGGIIFRTRKGTTKLTPITPTVQDNGYLSCVLYRDGKPYHKYVHHLVALAWVPKPPSLKNAVVGHKDGNKLNCSADNLVWIDASTNTKDAYRQGLATPPKGELNGKAKLTAKQVAAIRRSNKPNKALAKLYGVTPAAISMIKHGERW